MARRPYRSPPVGSAFDSSTSSSYHSAAMAKYDRLTALDASFLHMERLEFPMHVGALSIFEGAPFFDHRGHFRSGEVRELVLSRLPLLPRFRRRLMPVPYDQGRPIWVDDDRFDITYHVRHTALPKPGSWEQLIALTTRSEEHTSELQSQFHLVCRLLLEKKKKHQYIFLFSLISTIPI